MKFYTYLLIFALVYADQTVMTEEVFSEAVCSDHSSCLKCSFSEMRQIDSCFKSGFKQQHFCTISSNLNNTQSVTFTSSCEPSEKPVIGNFFMAFGMTCFSALLSLFFFIKKKSAKLQAQELSLSNIIKT